MWEAAYGLDDQLRWAAGLDVAGVPSARRAIVCGMGGSGVAGDVAALLGSAEGAFVAVHKDFGLPAWAAADAVLVVAVSYSGETEETLSAAADAGRLGLPVVTVSSGGALAATGDAQVVVPGGLQPRAAFGYLAGAVARVVAAAGLVKDVRPALERAAGQLDELVGPGGDGPAVRLADDLAAGLEARIPVVYGASGIGAVAARRWKTEINENAKLPAFAGELPEAGHNEIAGWGGMAELTARHAGLVYLHDDGDHPRVRRRFEVMTGIVEPAVPLIGEVWSHGETVLDRLTSLIVVGDLVSLCLARNLGIDPESIPPIQLLKQRLSEE
jgi:glucose/mannose-6-phosphate isomerase